MARLDLHPHEWPRLAFEAHFRHKPLAEKFGLSPRHFRRLIQDRLGTTVQAWLNQARMDIAPALLRKHRRAKEVAFLLGFKEQAHFSREFKDLYGVCPAAFLQWSEW